MLVLKTWLIWAVKGKRKENCDRLFLIWPFHELLLLLFMHTLRIQLLKKIAWSLHLNGKNALLDAHDSSEVESWCCYPHGGLKKCLSSSRSRSVGCSIEDEAMVVVRSESQGFTTLRVLLTYPLNWLKGQGVNEVMVPRAKPTPNRLPAKVLCTPVRSTLLHSIPSVWRPRADG